MARPHGPHTCYCPSCNYEVEADAYVQCNTLTCPQCGSRMRAKETGEFHQSRISNNKIATTGMVSSTLPWIKTESVPCAVCGFPIPEPSYVGQQVKCPYCGSINEAIKQGITIPTPVFAGLLGFVFGVVLGPSLLASTKSGSEWLAKKARERLG